MHTIFVDIPGVTEYIPRYFKNTFSNKHSERLQPQKIPVLYFPSTRRWRVALSFLPLVYILSIGQSLLLFLNFSRLLPHEPFLPKKRGVRPQGVMGEGVADRHDQREGRVVGVPADRQTDKRKDGRANGPHGWVPVHPTRLQDGLQLVVSPPDPTRLSLLNFFHDVVDEHDSMP